MVYTEFWIVVGLKLSREQILKYILDATGVIPTEDDEIDELFMETVVRPKLPKAGYARDLTLFQFVCCSESNGKVFILGHQVHKYYRKFVQCQNCEKYSVCDLCIGETSNGWYDVEKILNEPVEIPSEKICQNCLSDNVESNGRCTLCFAGKPKFGGGLSGYGRHVNTFAIEKLGWPTDKPVPVAHYYMTNDCLSCS
jgi:hypothetical protein